VALAVVGAFIMTTPAFAAELRQGDTIVVGADETVNDDLYAFGSTVTILGTVNGDVFAAGNNVTVSGTVTGDLFTAGNTMTISGRVGQSVRAGGGTLMLMGPVGEDALVAGGTAGIGSSAQIGRDLLAATGSLSVSGPVTRNALISGGQVSLAGPVGGYVKAEVDTLRLASGAKVAGPLTYTSPHQAEIASDATVGGTVQRFESQARQQPSGPFGRPGDAVIDWVRGLVGLTALGLLIVFLFPRFAQRQIEISNRSPWTSLGVGFVLLFGIPMLAVVMLIAGVIVGGWWLALLLLAAYAAALAVGYTMSAAFVGQSAMRMFHVPEQHLAWYLVAGLIMIGLVTLVPFLGGFIALLAVVFGLGALTLDVIDAYRARFTSTATAEPMTQQPEGALLPAPGAAS
jgi:cytoskeletal protein CcmA (bactofilin family)